MRTIIRIGAAGVAAAILLGMICRGMVNCYLANEPMVTKPITTEERAHYAANCVRHSGSLTTNLVIRH